MTRRWTAEDVATRRKGSAPKPLERDIQRVIMERLSLVPGVFVERMNTGAAKLLGRGGKEGLYRFGTPGAPDIRVTVAVPSSLCGREGCGHGIAVHARDGRCLWAGAGCTCPRPLPRVEYGRSLAIEVKRLGGKQSPEQLAWQAAFERVGGVYRVVRSVDEALAAVRDAGGAA